MKVIKLSSGCHYIPRPWFQETENGYLVKPADFYGNYSGTSKVIEVRQSA